MGTWGWQGNMMKISCEHCENIKGTSWEHENKTWEPFLKKYCTYNWCSTLAFVLAQTPFATHPPKQLFHVQIKLQVIFCWQLEHNTWIQHGQNQDKRSHAHKFWFRLHERYICISMHNYAFYVSLTRDIHHPSSHLPPRSIIWKIQGPLHCGWDFP
jgi:hypothetical protein